MLRRITDLVVRDLRTYDDASYYFFVGAAFLAGCVVLIVGGDVIVGSLLLAFPALCFYRALRTVRHRRRVEERVSRGPIVLEITDDATIVADATYALRNSTFGSMWPELRAKLDAEGIDPRSAVMADSYDIAPYGVEVGIVVGSGRVVKYRYDDRFVEWSDITDTWRAAGGSDAEYIEAALRLGAEENSSSTLIAH